MKRSGHIILLTAFLLSPIMVAGDAAADPPDFKPDDFPPSTAVASFMVQVGDKVTVGGPTSANFLPNEWMDVFVVPHHSWRETDPLAANVVKRIRIKSDAKGRLPLTDLWKPNQAGQFDIIVDYDSNGRFSYSLDALSSFVVRAK
jgi:hypothetical protein